MRRRRASAGNMASISTAIYLLLLCGAAQLCDGATRTSQRRKDTARTAAYLPSPSVETLKELAEAMGAAEFEHYTEGKALVKRLIPQNSEPDLDELSHQGAIGKAGVDFPAFPNIPPTGFNCKNVPTGYYADLETDCQVFHICDTSRKISFLCPNGTIFSQSHLICDWWFKVDCASAPALYESSAEYYSNEQKKTHKITQSLSKNSDLQQITDSSNIKEKTQPIRRIPLPTTTERLSRHRQRVQNIEPLTNVRATARSFHALYSDNNFSATQRTQATTPSTFDKRRKNLVQLIANNFGNTPTARTTLPSYTDSSTYRGDHNSIKEMQVAAESASFTNNNNRQYLQDFNNKNYRPYPVYNPEMNSRIGRTKTPTLTTLFVHDIRDKHFVNHPTKSTFDFTTKRPTLLPYTKSYGNILNEKHEPYTRPGVHLLKDFLDREKNKTRIAEKQTQVTERVDQYNTKQTFESVTKIPTTRSAENYFTQTASSDRFDVYSTNNFNQITTEPNYHERRERLIKKLNLDNNNLKPTEATLPTTAAEKLYGRKPGAILPSVLTPKTLHTLAIYYATALDNLSTTTPPLEDDEATTTYMDQFEKIEDGLPALFSRHTINEYSSLFGQGENSELFEELKFDPNNTLDFNEDLSVQQSQNPLSTSPQIRELAQVFTHALSAYLQDPVQFRKVLSDIRPTHPSFGDMLTTTSDENLINGETTTTVNEEDDEILGFSDDNKVKPGLAQLRDPKSLNLVTAQPRFAETVTNTTPRPFTTELSSGGFSSTARPFRCCGRISASYTTSSNAKDTATTPVSFSNTFASRINTLAPDVNETYITTTENSYTIPRYSGFQNNSNSDPYGKNVKPTNSKPINDYIEVTNLPTAWGVGNTETDSTDLPNTNSHYNVFESNKIRTSTTSTASPPTTTELNLDSESIELENDEELQRAHSQSFVTPQINNVQRQGKNINLEGDTDINEKQTIVKKPSEELEAPTLPDDYDTTTILPTTTALPTTTNKDDSEETTTTGLFTAPDSERITNNFQWSNSFENWHSTVILDPITLNDGLSATGPQQLGLSQLASQTPAWLPTQTSYYNTATTSDYPGPVYIGGINQANEQVFSSSQTIELTTPTNRFDSEKREGRLLKQPTSTSSSVDLTTIEDTVVEKAKEIMGGMNATTTEKLINVMKKTKSKTVRRLILLLVQTCDDDHNSTAEASKKALLDALMAVSQKDMDEVATEASLDEITTTSIPDVESNQFTNTHRRMDKIIDSNFRTRSKNSQRSGKSLGVDPSAVNSLTNPSTTESVMSTEIKIETTTVNTTPSPFSKSTPMSRRGARKYFTKTPSENKIYVNPSTEGPKFEARVANNPSEEQKTPSDTRAVELLKSLYTIVSRWG